MGANIELINVSKKYKLKNVVENVNIEINKGEFLTILGPSGAGKTTVLKMVAGFEKTSEGIIKIDDRNITIAPPHKRNIGMLFQNYALFPHMTVAENVSFPLSVRKISKTKTKEMVENILDKVKMKKYIDRLPSELSGGQQQRVALARALVFNPPILLLDEPMAALDKQLRKHMQIEIKQIQRELGITTISVTHDQEEALTMATKVCVMAQGCVKQIATPKNIYEYPENEFVASFIGEANLISGKVLEYANGISKVRILDNKIVKINTHDKEAIVDSKVSLLIRPEKLFLTDNENENCLIMKGNILQIIYIGEAVKLTIILKSGEEIKVKMFSKISSEYVIDDEITIASKEEDIVFIPQHE